MLDAKRMSLSEGTSLTIHDFADYTSSNSAGRTKRYTHKKTLTTTVQILSAAPYATHTKPLTMTVQFTTAAPNDAHTH